MEDEEDEELGGASEQEGDEDTHFGLVWPEKHLSAPRGDKHTRTGSSRLDGETGAEMLERSSGIVGAVVKMHKADPLTRLHKQTQTTSSREDKGTDGDDVYEQVPAATSPQTPAKQRRSWTCSTRPAQLSR